MKRFGIRSALAACAIAAATLPHPALAALRTYVIGTTTNSPAAATGSVTFDDAVCLFPGSNTLSSPVGCVVDLTIQIAGATSGNGVFTEENLVEPGFFISSMGPLDWDAELIAQGMTDVNFFFGPPGPTGMMPFVFGADSGMAEQFTIVSLTPGEPPEPEPAPEFPFAVDSQKCADAIGKAGAGYWTARHKSLAACRSDFMTGTPVYSDKAKTTTVESPSSCASEYKASASIARARAKVRATIAKRCTDALLADLFACAVTVNELADPMGTAGCVIEAIDGSVDDALEHEFGF